MNYKISLFYMALFFTFTHNALAVETAQQTAARQARRKELGQAGWFKPSYLDKWARRDNIPNAKAQRLLINIPEYWATLYGPAELMAHINNLPYFQLFQGVREQFNPGLALPDINPFITVLNALGHLAVNNPGGWHRERLREYRQYQAEQRRQEELLLQPQQQQNDAALEAALQASAREHEQSLREQEQLDDALRVSEISAEREAAEKARQEQEELEEMLALIKEAEEKEWHEQQARQAGAGPSTQRQPQKAVTKEIAAEDTPAARRQRALEAAERRLQERQAGASSPTGE